jgi:hypothetical protein
MGNETLQSKIWSTAVEDPRWQLVERIVASPYFAKSDRLCSILLYICELSLQGRADEINEVNIGSRLLGRRGYDPSVDGIVRSHASRMRQRLGQYFEGEGSQEPLRLLVPKGAYIPIFEPRPPERTMLETPHLEAIRLETGPIKSKDEAELKSIPNHLVLWILSLALALASITALALMVRLHRSAAANITSSIQHPLWSIVLGQGRPTTIVFSDASLALLQNITGHSVKLPEYLNSSYRLNIETPTRATTEVAKDLVTRRFTSIVDAEILTRFYRLPNIRSDWIRIGYSRDVRSTDFKEGSVVLLGTQESNPWVSIFQPHMNFVFGYDLHRRSFSVINRSPHGNELALYDYDELDPSHTVYGVAALRPNLSGSGYVLILEGTSAAGTEAAADFVFDDALLLPFLHNIRNSNGSLPYFEVLVQSDNLGGDASQLKIVAYRTSHN